MELDVPHLVDSLLSRAVRDRASDLHLEYSTMGVSVRQRVDGALSLREVLPFSIGAAVMARVKVLAGMDTSALKKPQDGRIKRDTGEGRVEMRVSSLPLKEGESLVLRILDRQAVGLSMDKLGLPEDTIARFRRAISHPNGIILATGPTGSGKTTTLYSAIREINREEIKILTVEDPVEYAIAGIHQVAVDNRIGLGFSTVLRSMLRHDPDVILVGEIRDPDTSVVAVQAALTGHLVMSTLHTRDSVGAIARMRDMGTESCLLASTLRGVMAQRLLRRLDPEFRRPVSGSLPGELREKLDLKGGPLVFYEGIPDVSNGMTGYRGRVGLFEWFEPDVSLREQITGQVSDAELRETAREAGMRTLREEGIRLALEGRTSLDEVLQQT